MAENLPIHEQGFVRAFILKEKQRRCAYLLSNPDRRKNFRHALAHFKWLDERFSQPILPSTAHTADELVAFLRQKGAGGTVWVISEYRPIDGREMVLEEAVQETCGRSCGSVLSCIPGKLAFFRDEEMQSQRLLERQ
jgi:hypothetical protein